MKKIILTLLRRVDQKKEDKSRDGVIKQICGLGLWLLRFLEVGKKRVIDNSKF